MTIAPLRYPEKVIFTFCLAGIVLGSCFDFFDIAWGTGVWLGELAFTWALIFVSYSIFCIAFFTMLVVVIWRDKVYVTFAHKIISLRDRMRSFRWLLAVVIFVFPIVLFQFTVWGIVFQGLFIRSLMWVTMLFLVSVLVTNDTKLISWANFLTTLILTAAAFSVTASLKFVTEYPFSLGWSEGNRLWDYSVMFGRDRYDYPADREIFVLLEDGRQLVGGIPFLIPGISIEAMRAWVGLLTILPYFVLGLISFRSFYEEKVLWVILGLCTYLFLKQGPIHPPLVICAILVAAAWRSSLWVAVPLVILSGYFASISRYTWIFAPALWILLLEFSGAISDKDGGLQAKTWIRAVVLFCFGLFGSLLLPQLLKILQIVPPGAGNFVISPENLQANVTRQPLLWYRLFPNPTYGSGILIGLFLAIAPLVYLLFYLARRGRWTMNIWQKLAIILPLLAFLGVGGVVSTKIGGGGDLHNMDMLLIGLFFTTVIAWHNSEWRNLLLAGHTGLRLKLVVILLLVIPALGALMEMRSYNFGKATPWLVALTDTPNEKALEMYPPQNVIDDSLNLIQREVELALGHGDVLFLDQRQLLTFGFITNVPLVPEYDKKVLMEQALASNRRYFEEFYRDLQEGRFSLIITQPLNTSKKGSDYQFGEENNAWVKWVANPLLCYYKVKQTFLEVNVQLLVPDPEDVDCSKKLP